MDIENEITTIAEIGNLQERRRRALALNRTLKPVIRNYRKLDKYILTIMALSATAGGAAVYAFQIVTLAEEYIMIML